MRYEGLGKNVHPVVGPNVCVKEMGEVEPGDHHEPHSEPTLWKIEGWDKLKNKY